MFRTIAVAFMTTYVVAWLCLYAVAMDANPQDVAANFLDYVRLSWTPGAGELVAFIQFGAVAIAGVVALVLLPCWRAMRTFRRRSRA